MNTQITKNGYKVLLRRLGLVIGTLGGTLSALAACNNLSIGSSDSQTLSDQEKAAFVSQQLTPLEQDSDRIFRDLFAWHLQREGFNAADIGRAVFLTPPDFQKIPDPKYASDPATFMAAMTDHYRATTPYDWYRWGLSNPANPQQPQTPKKPATVVVIPGIFGEFIKSYPFHEIATNQNSIYYQKWQSAITPIQDEVYSLADLKSIPKPMSEVIKFGSYDIDGAPWINVIVLEARLGSLETLGTLESNIQIYKRRLQKIFEVITDDSDLYILGYSRGTPVALELISQVMPQKSQFPWASRIKGVIGLGGAFYGTKVADLAIEDPSSANGKTIAILKTLVQNLKDRPDAPSLVGKTFEGTKIVAHNTMVWQQALRQFLSLNSQNTDPILAAATQGMSEELKFRRQSETLQNPELQGTLKYVFDFGTSLLQLDCPISCYFDNIAGFKLLMTRAIEGLETLTVKSRMTWWQQSALPQDLRILTVTGTMPDQFKQGIVSPLFESPFYGKGTVDFNSMLRNAFYGNAAIDGTEINDSQMTNFNSRYWPSLFPNHNNKSYYLGAMGTHHWGFAFPKAVDNANGEVNTFPRSALMAAIGSFIYELDAAENP